MSDGGKGSKRRKENTELIHNNWDRIFGKKTNEPTTTVPSDVHDNSQDSSSDESRQPDKSRSDNR